MARVPGVLGEVQGPLRQLPGPPGLGPAVLEQAPVGVQPGLLAPASRLVQQGIERPKRRLVVALGEVGVPAAGVYVAKLVLEPGEGRPVRECRGGFVVGQRRHVLAQQRAQVAHSLVQHACPRVPERERCLVVGQRVRVGVQGPPMVPGEPEVLGGLLLAASAGLAHCVKVEGTAQNGCGGEQLPARLAHRPQAPF